MSAFARPEDLDGLSVDEPTDPDDRPELHVVDGSPIAAALEAAWDEHSQSRDEDEPTADELPGGQSYADAWSEAEREGGRQWRMATDDERIRLVTAAAMTRRRREAGRPTIGRRHAGDLLHGSPPAQLAGAFLTPEGPTVIYAHGGTGKGVTTCWLAQQLVANGHRVMVVDFEGHEREWGSRLRGLRLSDEDLASIHYRAPFGADWTAPTGSLAKVAELVRDDAAALGITYLIVDSYSVATSNGDTMGGEQAAREYFTALAMIGLPSLTIAHVNGQASKWPDRPFGSVFVHNLARETWAVARVGDATADDGEPSDPYEPKVVALELRNKKSNTRAASRAQYLTFTFYLDGTIDANTDPHSGRSVADLAADALADGPLTRPKIIAAIREDTGELVTDDALRKALTRHPQRFVESAGARPRTWSTR